MLLFLSILGVLLSVILVSYNARKNISTVFLGAFFFLVSLYGLYQFALVYSKSPPLIAVFLMNFALITSPLYMIGPMLFWYVRSVLRDDWILVKTDLWHLLPAVIFFIASTPYGLVPVSHKMEMAEAVVRDLAIIRVYKTTILADLFSIHAVYLSRPFLVLIYALWSGELFVRFLTQGSLSAVFSGQRFMRAWICLLLGFVIIMSATHILLIAKIFAMGFSELFFTLSFLRLFCWSALIGLLVSPFFFPAVLYGLPRVPDAEGGARPDVSSAGETGKKQARSGREVWENRSKTRPFEEEYLYGIGRKVESHMEQGKPYLDPDFNLTWLSAQLRIPAHHLGYYFREVKKQPFIDYRNKWRVNHAKKLIRDGKASLLTLEAIGKQSGFSSRNTFRTTFEKFEGIPPSVFSAREKQ
jgi:AraC-like DNA-binding protein